MVKVSQIERNSIADELGITAGTELLTVNGRPLADFLDWEFLTADEELVIEARQPDGEEIIYELERLDGEPHRQVGRAPDHVDREQREPDPEAKTPPSRGRGGPRDVGPEPAPEADQISNRRRHDGQG